MSSDELGFKLRRKTRPVPSRIRLHQDLRLDSREKMLALATDMQKLNLSRRQIPDWMADRIYGFEGEILDEDGRPFELDDEAIDLAFNNDGSFRWLSDFFRVTREPPRQRAQRRVLRRLKLIYLALYIEYCVVNAERRSESLTFFDLPDGGETDTTPAVIAIVLHFYLRIEFNRDRLSATVNLAQVRRLTQGWLSVRAFRRSCKRRPAQRSQQSAIIFSTPPYLSPTALNPRS